MRHTYLICYDVSDDLRRAKVLKALKGYGDHPQYSVFECQLNTTGLAKCRHALSQVIHHRDDQVLFVRPHWQCGWPSPCGGGACRANPVAQV